MPASAVNQPTAAPAKVTKKAKAKQTQTVLEYCNIHGIKWQPIPLIVENGKKTFPPSFQKSTDFVGPLAISDAQLKARQELVMNHEYIAIDISDFKHIDVDTPEYDPIFDEYKKEMPYYLSSTKALPHILFKPTAEIQGGARPKICDKYPKVEILNNGWSFVHRDAIMHNHDKPIKDLDVSFMLAPMSESKPKNKSKIDIFNRKNDIAFLNKPLVVKLVACINQERADSYADWTDIGWTLYNISETLLDEWVEFSKKSSKYSPGECEKLWAKMKESDKTIGTLKWYAKSDNPMKYSEIVSEDVEALLDIAIGSKGAHLDVAKAVAKYFDNEFVYIQDGWWYFNPQKHIWQQNKKGNILRNNLDLIIKEFMKRSGYWSQESNKSTYDEEDRDKYAEKAKRALAIATNLKDTTYRNHIMKECESLFTDNTNKFLENLDSKGHLMAFANGVYDFKRLEFREGRPDDMISFTTGYDYVADVSDSIMDDLKNIIDSIFTNPEVKKFWMDSMTLALNGALTKEDFYIHTGHGGNGKGVLDDIVRLMLGDYYTTINSRILTLKKLSPDGAEPEIARLKGKRMCTAVEPDSGSTFQMGTIKSWTGGGKMVARGLYKDPVEFKAQFSLNLQCNELPNIPDVKDAEFRRIKLIHYPKKFCDDPNPNNPLEAKTDKGLKERLEENVEYRQALAILLINNYATINIKDHIMPKELADMTNKYLTSNDILKNWFGDCIKIDVKCKMGSKELFDLYIPWCKTNSVKTPLTHEKFKEAFSEKYYNGAKPSKSNGIMKYIGFSPIQIEDSDSESDHEE